MSRCDRYSRLLSRTMRSKSPVQPILDNPGKSLAGTAAVAAVVGAGIWVGLFLRKKRLGTYRNPYESRGFQRGRRDDLEDYEAVGI